MSRSEMDEWPELPYAAWKDTCDTLHLWTQIVGKIRLVQTPWLNHSWHVALYVTARGLTTSPIPYRERAFQIDFDFVDHVLWVRASDARISANSCLGQCLSPNSIPNCSTQWPNSGSMCGSRRCRARSLIPFRSIRTTCTSLTIAIYAARFWRVLLSTHEVLAHFRTGFLGKASPVHFFWAASTWRSPASPGDPHRIIPAGCLICPTLSRRRHIRTRCPARASGPEGAGQLTTQPSIPTPIRFRRILPILPCGRVEAFFSQELGEFIAPYDAVRTARDPERTLMEFLQTTYDAAADLGRWDRAALECPFGEPGRPRLIR